MKKFLSTILFATVFLALSMSLVSAEKRFIVVNETGKNIRKLCLTSSSSWEENQLSDGDFLADGEYIYLELPNDDNVRYWDMKIIFTNGGSHFWTMIDLSNCRKVTIDNGLNLKTK